MKYIALCLFTWTTVSFGMDWQTDSMEMGMTTNPHLKRTLDNVSGENATKRLKGSHIACICANRILSIPADSIITIRLPDDIAYIKIPGSEENLYDIEKIVRLLVGKYGYQMVADELGKETINMSWYADIELYKMLMKYCHDDTFINTLAALNLPQLIGLVRHARAVMTNYLLDFPLDNLSKLF